MLKAQGMQAMQLMPHHTHIEATHLEEMERREGRGRRSKDMSDDKRTTFPFATNSLFPNKGWVMKWVSLQFSFIFFKQLIISSLPLTHAFAP